MAQSAPDMSKHFTIPALLRYALPSIAMAIFTSIYGIVDGLFISNYAGTTAFAAVNFIMPVIMILSTTGFMFGTGGSAIISIMRGKGDAQGANRTFSLIVYTTLATGVILSVIGIIGCRWISETMGATGEMLDDCTLYGRLVFLSLTGYVLQCAFQSLMMAAGKPKLGFGITVASGLANIVLDFVLVGVMGMGIVGAALATNVSEWLGGLAPIIYFARKNSSFLRLGKTSFNGRLLGKICANGSSEMMTNLAVSLISVIYNLQLLAYIGENGVAAYGVIMYVFLIFEAVFIGYSMATGPLLGYQYGARNFAEMRSLTKKSIAIVLVAGIFVFGFAQLLAWPLSQAFCSYDQDLAAYTEHAFRLFYLCFLFAGFNVYGSSFFTALGNGVVSAAISFVRTLVLETLFVLVLPMVFGPEALWYACLIADFLAALIVTGCMKYFAPVYGYGKNGMTKPRKAKKA